MNVADMNMHSESLARRLLDALAASGQFYASVNGQAAYRWGQHIWTASGDNLTQYGLHGTSQSVIGLAAGIQHLRSPSRYDAFLGGGKLYLEEVLETPKKPLDRRKVGKLAELLAALSSAGAEPSKLKQAGDALLNGKVSGGWGFDVEQKSSQDAHYLPTIFAADALLRAHKVIPGYLSAVDVALNEALASLPTEHNENQRLAATFRLQYVIDNYRRLTGKISSIQTSILPALRNAYTTHISLDSTVRFEYSISDGSSSQHAFYTVPIGLLQFYTELNIHCDNLDIPLPKGRLEERCEELVASICGGHRIELSHVESCSLAIRLLFAFRDPLDKLLARQVATTQTNANVTHPAAPLSENSSLRDIWSALKLKHLAYISGGLITVLSGVWGLGWKLGSNSGETDLKLSQARTETLKEQLFQEQDLSRGAELKARVVAFADRYKRAVEAKDAKNGQLSLKELEDTIQAGVLQYEKGRANGTKGHSGLMFHHGDGSQPPSVTFAYDQSTFELPKEISVNPAPKP